MKQDKVDTIEIRDFIMANSAIEHSEAETIAKAINLGSRFIDSTNLATKDDIHKLRLVLKDDYNSLDIKIEKQSTILVKWMVGMLIAQTGIIVGILQILGGK